MAVVLCPSKLNYITRSNISYSNKSEGYTETMKISGMCDLDLLIETLEEENPEAIVYDDADEAVLGLVYHNDKPPILAYSYIKWIKMLMNRDGMSEDEAVEYFDYNVDGLILGDNQPIIIRDHML